VVDSGGQDQQRSRRRRWSNKEMEQVDKAFASLKKIEAVVQTSDEKKIVSDLFIVFLKFIFPLKNS
jgi:hypothetical protein